MTVKVTGMKEALARLDRAEAGVGGAGLARLITLVTGNTHRYLMSLSASGTPSTAKGVLPVVTGRLKNSFFWETKGTIGFVGSNVKYGPRVEFGFQGTDSSGRKYGQPGRGFLERTVRDMQRPINNLVSAHVSRVAK